ncbi:MAG: tRNA (N(6)-L-threonylcarbamoyladenosine(37)-C(2))-methylthiotransferase MtaB [Lachnospiraceae bacterium]|nr:tRNA (N(6)-L-threonylcarbamoyladenosine(37)-C(2))-methylthiotransferase MtaB [Lachnospiraceae bacterium]
MRQLTFAIHTLGCKVNTYESDAMAEALRAAGFAERSFEEPADVYIINTCTVTNVADRKSRQMLRRARKFNPEALVVAAGCYVDDAAKNDRLEELISSHVIDVAVPNANKKNIVSIIKNALIEENNSVIGENVNVPDPRLFLTELDGHTRAFIKVQDGCNMFCSYCVIPYVRGRLQARPVEEVLEEIRTLAERGVAETVITGIHLSSLGDGLLRLVEGIEGIDGIKRIRFGSLEPTLITEAFTARLRQSEKLCPHFHLSLQSGSDTVLKRMNRHYTAADFERSCDILRRYYEHPAITTDIIVGFPGETEEEFRATCDLAEQVGFYEAHVFKYSRRRGTVADRMPDQIPEPLKAARSEELIRITDRLSHEFRSYYLGKDAAFLSEELVKIGGELYETGFTPEYVRCIKKSESLHQNEIIVGKTSHIVQQNVIDESLVLL